MALHLYKIWCLKPNSLPRFEMFIVIAGLSFPRFEMFIVIGGLSFKTYSSEERRI